MAAAVLLAVAGVLLHSQHDVIATDVGEQRILALDDGSRVYLNTDSRARILYGPKERRIELVSGEALFEVANQPGRPFVVTAGDREILALGTSFVVRRSEDRLAVTLVEGKVRVTSKEAAPDTATSGRSRILTRGQRLTFTPSAVPKLDAPPLEKLTAWKQGQVALEDVPLAFAVAEMNRYSNLTLSLAPEVSSVNVSGIFRAGDSMNFARAVAKTYQLEVVEEGRTLLLKGVPRAPVPD